MGSYRMTCATPIGRWGSDGVAVAAQIGEVPPDAVCAGGSVAAAAAAATTASQENRIRSGLLIAARKLDRIGTVGEVPAPGVRTARSKLGCNAIARAVAHHGATPRRTLGNHRPLSARRTRSF